MGREYSLLPCSSFFLLKCHRRFDRSHEYLRIHAISSPILDMKWTSSTGTLRDTKRSSPVSSNESISFSERRSLTHHISEDSKQLFELFRNHALFILLWKRSSAIRVGKEGFIHQYLPLWTNHDPLCFFLEKVLYDLIWYTSPIMLSFFISIRWVVAMIDSTVSSTWETGCGWEWVTAVSARRAACNTCSRWWEHSEYNRLVENNNS